MLTLLQIVQNACGEMGLPAPQQVVGNTDPQAVQLFALANREGREQVKSAWPQLQGLQTITLVAGQASYPMPADYKSYIPATIWEPQKRWPVQGPLSPQEWEVLKQGYINILPYSRYRIMQGQIFFDPVPTSSGEPFVIEYQSNAFCQSDTGVNQSYWLKDDDVWRLPDDLAVLGIKWRFLAAKGLNYAEEKKAWADACDQEMAIAPGLRDMPTNLNTTIGINVLGDGYSQVGDGNYPGR